MENKMENEMETGGIYGFKELNRVTIMSIFLVDLVSPT